MDASGIRAGRAYVEIGANLTQLEQALQKATALMATWMRTQNVLVSRANLVDPGQAQTQTAVLVDLTSALNDANIELADIDDQAKTTKERLEKTKSTFANFRDHLTNATASLHRFSAALAAAGRQLLLSAAAIAAPAVLATKTYMGLSDKLMAVRAVTGATEAQFQTLANTAKLLGRTTSYTAAEVADAMLNLARAGFAPEEINDAIAGMLNLARATGTDLATAADIAAGTLRAFGLEASQMTHVADVLTATANNSAQTMMDLGEAMKYAAPVAAEAGLSLEETSKALGVLANMSIKGSMAGTTLRQILMQLAKPDVRQEIERLGVATTDAAGNLRTDLGTMLAEIGTAINRLPSAERIAILQKLFDQRAVGAAAKLARSDFPALTRAIDEAAGTAERTAATMDSGIGGAWRRFTSALEGVALAIGETLSAALTRAMDYFSGLLDIATSWLENNRAAVFLAGALAAAIAGLGTGLIAAGAAAKALSIALSAVGVIIGLVSGAASLIAGAFSLVLTPVGALITALIATAGVAAYMTEAWKPALDWLAEAFTSVSQTAVQAWRGISDALAAGDLQLAAEIALTGLKLVWLNTLAWITQKWADLKTALITLWYDAVYGIAQMALTGIAGIQTLWVNLQATFRRLWVNTVKFLGDTWDGLYYWLAKAFTKLTHLFASAAEKAAAEKAIDQEQSRRAIERERKTQEELAKIDREAAAKRENIDTALMDTLATLEEDKQRALKNATEPAQDNADKIKQQAEEAKKKFDDLTKKAEDAKNRASAEEPTPPPPPAPPTPKELTDHITTKIPTPEKLSSAGTFSAAAVRGLGIAGPLDRIAKASEATAEYTKKIASNTEQQPEFD